MSLSRRNSRMKRVAAAFAATILLFLLPQTVGAAPAARPTSSADLVHIVRPGDTLANLAATYGVSVEEIRAYNNLHNRAELVSCDPNNDSTQVRGTVRRNGEPVSGYRVVFSWRADETVVARAISGHASSPGFYSHILDGGGPREGNWWVWIENEAGQRISEAGFVHTDRLPHTGKCQRAVIDFDIQDPGQIYVGRKLNVPVSLQTAGAPSRARPAPKYYGHVIRQGETLENIAASYGTSTQELKVSNSLTNKAQLVSCDPNGINTQVRGIVRHNGSPADGYRVAFSWQPDGEVVARRTTGGGGHYTHILSAAGPREGNWWFWIENEDEHRISEMGHVQTDSGVQAGSCQWAVINFDIHNPDLLYIGSKLHIPIAR